MVAPNAFAARPKKLYYLYVLVVGAITFCSMGRLNAQVVYSAQYKSDADVKVFVTQYKSDADLVVYKTKYKSDAGNNDGIWFFTEYKSDAKKVIYFTEYKSDADLIIYFTEYKSDAGWKNNSKKHWMF